MIEYICKY